jgi:hypothetical protein
MRRRWIVAAFVLACAMAAVIWGIAHLSSITSRVVVTCEIADASVENVRWIEERREVYVDPSLLPGERGHASLGPSLSPRRGHLAFDLVLDGGRVALHTRNAVTIAPGETKQIRLLPETAVEHPSLPSREAGGAATRPE